MQSVHQIAFIAGTVAPGLWHFRSQGLWIRMSFCLLAASVACLTQTHFHCDSQWAH